ncbi:putative antirestriction adenine methyltransferase [Streptomyces sp. NPDC001635]
MVIFPPFYASDYQAQFAPIDAAFDWPPSFDELTEDGKERIIEQVQDRPNWVLGLHIERPELRDKLAGVVQTANRGLPIYVYAGPRRIVRPRQPIETIRMPKISPGEDLGDRMTIHVLTGGQFAAIRSQFMSKSIKPGSPLIACGRRRRQGHRRVRVSAAEVRREHRLPDVGLSRVVDPLPASRQAERTALMRDGRQMSSLAKTLEPSRLFTARFHYCSTIMKSSRSL